MSEPIVRGDKMCFMADGIKLAADDVDSAFRWLSKWEVASPLRPYTELAQGHGTPNERELTLLAVGDLRQPVYDTRLVFVRKTPTTEALLKAWDEEKRHCRCTQYCGLPFLRAVWRVKPLLLALPQGWITA